MILAAENSAQEAQACVQIFDHSCFRFKIILSRFKTFQRYFLLLESAVCSNFGLTAITRQLEDFVGVRVNIPQNGCSIERLS